MKKVMLAALLCFWLGSVSGQQKLSSKILFVPLDPRPPCLKLTQKMGLIGDAEVVAPPMEFLGNFQKPGDSEQIITWLKTQDLNSYDAAIIVVDMLSYGGLVASRRHLTESAVALERLEVIKHIKKRAPGLKIYGQNVIMRLAPSADGKNEAYREKLATWAKISPDPAAKTEVSKLEADIPADVLLDYKKARERNYKTNLKAIDFVKDGLIDYLILSQDDASPKGVHVVDRENLINKTKSLGLTERIAVQPGADEVSMLLLSRALSDRFHFKPLIKAVYSSAKLENTVMPFEDRTLAQTVSHHIKAAGGREVSGQQKADVLFYVFASRHEPGVAQTFAAQISQELKAGKKVIVADIDPIGNVQGGDSVFSEALSARNIFAGLSGYASWNTAGNTIGTALPEGVVFTLAESRFLKDKMIVTRIWTAHNWFMINRVVDDYYYHNLVRAKANTYLTGKKLPSAVLMNENDNKKVEAYCLSLLNEHMKVFLKNYVRSDSQLQHLVSCKEPENLTFVLPWNRTFEADIDFDITCQITR